MTHPLQNSRRSLSLFTVSCFTRYIPAKANLNLTFVALMLSFRADSDLHTAHPGAIFWACIWPKSLPKGSLHLAVFSGTWLSQGFPCVLTLSPMSPLLVLLIPSASWSRSASRFCLLLRTESQGSRTCWELSNWPRLSLKFYIHDSQCRTCVQ